MADKKTTAETQGIQNPHVSGDPTIDDDKYADLDPTKVVGTYAMQPDPNKDRPAPLPNVPNGVNEAPADDEPGTLPVPDPDGPKKQQPAN